MTETKDRLADNGNNSDETMTDNGPRPEPHTRVMELAQSPPHREGLGSDAFVDRFHRRSVLGRGGMGEVTLWRDDRLGREVAVKTMLPHAVNDHAARARFLREARVQGQLEHPAIVPVHDLRQDGDGNLSLTMKRVRGKTLAELLEQRHDPTSASSTTLRRLLSAFASVCLALEFAHARGIVHRDLKPGNIMLGDFGEVYVLDWGLAKIIDDATDDPGGPVVPESSDGAAAVMTQAGSVLGTLGYMAPEQLDDGLGDVSAATDVYALGAILCEILTGKPLLSTSSSMKRVQETLRGVDVAARVRLSLHPVPPELEDVCVCATKRLPHDRLGSARAMHDAVERHLEGDRDLDRRKALAAAHIAAADVAFAGAIMAHANQDDEAQGRATAMRELGAAIALEPGNIDAGRAVLRVLATPPRHTPTAVRAELDEIDNAQLAAGTRTSTPLAMLWLLFIPLVLVMRVLDWRPVVATLVGIFLVIAVSAINVSKAKVPIAHQIVAYLLRLLLCLSAGFLGGPFVMVPTFVTTFIAVLQSHPAKLIRVGAVVMGCGLFAFMVALEWAGVLPSSYAFVDGGLRIVPVAVGLPETPTRVLLLLSSLASMIAVALFIARMRGSLAAAQERVSLLGWHLRQLVPDTGPSKPHQ